MLLDALDDTRHVRPAGTVTLVGGGPGQNGRITVDGLIALQRADVVVTDHLAPRGLLDHLPPHVTVIDAAKHPRGPATPQETINRLLVEHAGAGRRVVRLKGGDPFVFGRGYEEIEACAAAGIAVDVCPGVSSAIAGPAVAGIPVTHRGSTQGFTVVSGHLPPDHPGSTVDWSALARGGTTLVVLMGVATLGAITAKLRASGLPGDTPAAVVADAGHHDQRQLRGTLDSIAADAEAAAIQPPAITVIGAVAALRPEPR
ncbi:uroporphyrinogen-III C-methyltransferase [Streptomyces sp. SL54]|uniref:uroporphyrinogen-III C-methyltransferase n=1 Tax=Streptantibioticus silvisoli TaxID=2705255 RepID=A0ABT6W797_9ACTN|nr:uroporphyrinogen-III C-methyltransferase [Streptantibioticus silvisoli]